MNRLLSALVFGLLFAGQSPTAAEPVPPAAAVIRAEALRSQQDPSGRPLPLAAHWHRQSLTLALQLQMIREGRPILPWMDYWRKRTYSTEELAALATLQAWQLPLVLITGGQWEADFYTATEYKVLPLNQTGLADDLEGNRVAKVSPFSPVAPWRELGKLWTNNASADALQRAYPDPPLVLFASNNEAGELKPSAAESSKTYVDLYGLGQSMEFRRKVFGDGWITRYGALFQGMREGLKEPSWKTNSRFIGYNSFGPDHFGASRSPLVTEDRISPNWYMWQGAVAESYDNDWEPDKLAFNLWSTQIEAMNQVFMKDEAYAVNPDFWFELLFWDGYTWDRDNLKAQKYAAAKVEYTPALYKGWAQYNLWILVPRVAREWRSSADDKQRWWGFFEAILQAVEAVHNEPLLTRFWRLGELVPNLSMKHPFDTEVPKKWADTPRWFHLSTSLDPDLSGRAKWLVNWRDDGHHFPVWTMARVIGEAPKREWLVYAHAPMGERKDVTVDVPVFRKIKLPRIDIEGTFYHVVEETGAVTEVVVAKSPGKPAPPANIRVSHLVP